MWLGVAFNICVFLPAAEQNRIGSTSMSMGGETKEGAANHALLVSDFPSAGREDFDQFKHKVPLTISLRL